ncbi:MAG: hypothetical protein QOI31_466 [Solirubrobacterales bacterium]|jgi:hypothetical protein|nr:hypothetical protein [Solirubrobacterales bacterium]
MSFVRVVRFTGVDSERVAALKERVAENDGPPEGVPSTALRVLLDEEQGTAVVLQSFDSMDDLKTGEAVLSAMDPGDTPGTRESVDRCEVMIDVSA